MSGCPLRTVSEATARAGRSCAKHWHSSGSVRRAGRVRRGCSTSAWVGRSTASDSTTSNCNLARVATVQAERAVADACLRLCGSHALEYDSTANHQLRKSMAAGIAAGTYEIQLNLVSRQHLGLPKG
jgi:alkylation response protein AidB-like acyl-CoA dehydrogenase